MTQIPLATLTVPLPTGQGPAGLLPEAFTPGHIPVADFFALPAGQAAPQVCLPTDGKGHMYGDAPHHGTDEE